VYVPNGYHSWSLAVAGAPKFDISEAAEMDYPEHEKTYGLFLGMFKWGTIAVVIILILMAIFLL